LMLHHYVRNGRDSFRSMGGSVFLDAEGNKYFRADHMSQSSTEQQTRDAAEQIWARNKEECVGWELKVFPEARDFTDLINKLRPIHPAEYLATLSP